jgi:hypothetical protein
VNIEHFVRGQEKLVDLLSKAFGQKTEVPKPEEEVKPDFNSRLYY